MRFQPHPTDPERFFYDNMTLVRYVEDPKYSVPGWMGLPKGTDVTGATRPEIEHHFVGGERADLGEWAADPTEQIVDMDGMSEHRAAALASPGAPPRRLGVVPAPAAPPGGCRCGVKAAGEICVD